MTIYKALKDNVILLMKLKKAGIITVTPVYWMRVYEDFKKIKTGSKQDRYEIVSEKHNISAGHVRNVVTKLSQTL